MRDQDVDEFEDWCESAGGRFRETTESKTRKTKWECSVDDDIVSLIDMKSEKKHIELTQGNRNSRSGVHVATMGIGIDPTGSIRAHGPSMKVKKDASHRGTRFR